MKDGGLRTLFRNKFKSWQWTSIETAGSATGVPDSEFCTPEGAQGWIEFKQTHIFHVQISPLQVAWVMRRCRYAGNAWIAVRRTPTAKKYRDIDELWLIAGLQAAQLLEGGLMGFAESARWKWDGGPSNWDWDKVASILQSRQR